MEKIYYPIHPRGLVLATHLTNSGLHEPGSCFHISDALHYETWQGAPQTISFFKFFKGSGTLPLSSWFLAKQGSPNNPGTNFWHQKFKKTSWNIDKIIDHRRGVKGEKLHTFGED